MTEDSFFCSFYFGVTSDKSQFWRIFFSIFSEIDFNTSKSSDFKPLYTIFRASNMNGIVFSNRDLPALVMEMVNFLRSSGLSWRTTSPFFSKPSKSLVIFGLSLKVLSTRSVWETDLKRERRFSRNHCSTVRSVS